MTTATTTQTPNTGCNKKQTKKSGRTWRRARGTTDSTITWKYSDEIGSVSVTPKGYTLGKTFEKQGYYFARLQMPSNAQPTKIDLEFSSNLAEGAVALASQAGNLVQCGTQPIPTLSVPIHWLRTGEKFLNGQVVPAPKGTKDTGIRAPHTRQRGKDNVDIVLLLPDGTFVDLQVSLVTFGGNFWLCIQEIWVGQTVQVPDIQSYQMPFKTVEVDGRHYFVAPVWAEYAYPGADFLKVMSEMGPKLVRMTVEAGRYLVPDADGINLPEWRVEVEKPAGWPSAGVVLYYNPMNGARILGSDGEEYFAHLRVIPNLHGDNAIDEGSFPILYPMQPVAFRWKEPDTGKNQKDRNVTEMASIAEAA